MLDETKREGYLAGRLVMRKYVTERAKFMEYRIVNDDGGKYRIWGWAYGQGEPEVVAQGLTADQAWTFFKLAMGD